MYFLLFPSFLLVTEDFILSTILLLHNEICLIFFFSCPFTVLFKPFISLTRCLFSQNFLCYLLYDILHWSHSSCIVSPPVQGNCFNRSSSFFAYMFAVFSSCNLDTQNLLILSHLIFFTFDIRALILAITR